MENRTKQAKEKQTPTAKDQALETQTVTPQPNLTTDQGLKVSDDQNTLRAGVRGPSLLEDFHFREKITHFDHERIPERVVHARGTAAHGVFQVYEPLAELTRANFLQNPSAQTPVFVRFSTVAGSRGSADTARDVRGFAVKFYTEEGNFDLVGNNIPIFFIQDAIKFPDLIHAAKPEPNNEIPQAQTAHDTFWDFISLTPESMHMVMWIMSDRAIPRSFSMMEGFGVHTFRLVNGQGKSRFVKFHWKPVLGIHSLVWDEAQKLGGKDPDFHRRDLWEAIKDGNYPEYELGIQILEQEDEFKFDFDVLDATKIWPEDLVPVRRIGKMTLNRNPDNFFAETEQVAFHTANIVPGIDFTNDPLLQGRLFSYLDTQLLRLGGPNFHEIPINRPVARINNNQRDGFHRETINPGRVSYEPNSLGGNIPADTLAAEGGYASYPEPMEGPKVRERSQSFNDHYGQARLFFNSMTQVEQEHITAALQFELSLVETQAVKQRMLSHLARINGNLAAQVAAGLGEIIPQSFPPINLTPPQTAVFEGPIPTTKPTASGGLEKASALSMEGTPKDSIKGRKVAILAMEGVNTSQVETLKTALLAGGAKGMVVSQHLGPIKGAEGKELPVDRTLANCGSVLFDGVFVPGGAQSVQGLQKQGLARFFLAEAFKHCKTIGVMGEGSELLAAANIPGLPAGGQAGAKPGLEAPQGVLIAPAGSKEDEVAQAFINSLKQHRHWDRPQKDQIPA